MFTREARSFLVVHHPGSRRCLRGHHDPGWGSWELRAGLGTVDLLAVPRAVDLRAGLLTGDHRTGLLAGDLCAGLLDGVLRAGLLARGLCASNLLAVLHTVVLPCGLHELYGERLHCHLVRSVAADLLRHGEQGQLER